MAFACPRCGRVSHHPDDESHGYCGACHEFTGEGITRALITAAGFSAGALVTAPEIPVARLAAALVPGDGGALIARSQPGTPPEPAQLPPAVQAPAPEPDGAAYTWHPGDPVLLKAQPGVDIYQDI
jgi:hypothetical protein